MTESYVGVDIAKDWIDTFDGGTSSRQSYGVAHIHFGSHGLDISAVASREI